MALTINTNLKNDADGYLLDAKNVKGGYVVVNNTTERDALYSATSITGTKVYVVSEGKEYRKTADGWEEIVVKTDDSPTTLAELSDDETHRLVTDTEKETWNNKQNALSDSDKQAIANLYSDNVFVAKYDAWNSGTVTNSTWDEIKTAYEAGKVILLYDGSSSFIPLSAYSDVTGNQSACFSIVNSGFSNGEADGDVYVNAFLLINGVWKNLYEDYDNSKITLTKDLPTTLKNPNAITFTGGATGTYDGSEAVTINIPTGGGSSVTVDSSLSDTSENPVQNKIIKEELDKKYEKPEDGIPASDLADGIIPNLDNYTKVELITEKPTENISTTTLYILVTTYNTAEYDTSVFDNEVLSGKTYTLCVYDETNGWKDFPSSYSKAQIIDVMGDWLEKIDTRVNKVIKESEVITEVSDEDYVILYHNNSVTKVALSTLATYIKS